MRNQWLENWKVNERVSTENEIERGECEWGDIVIGWQTMRGGTPTWSKRVHTRLLSNKT